MPLNQEKGLYIHIPFCKRKCDYCDFVSFDNKNRYIKEYIEALKKEINIVNQNNKNKLTTVYIGGGTPSAIDSDYIIEILNSIRLNQKNLKEITIEINPGTINKDTLQKYYTAGVNRLSIGLQETNNKLLKSIGRIHTYEQFYEIYSNAREVGFNNINVDLIIGLPNQSIKDVEKSIDRITKINPEHISVYSLILEEGTKLYKKYINNEVKIPSEEKERQMYWYVKDKLESNGYIHYEISNFSKEGYESKHNLDCWNQNEYIGVGIAAHSYENGVRYSNINELEKYIENIKNQKYQENKIIHEVQNTIDKEKEYMLLGLRKINGVSIKKFKNKFCKNPIFLFKKELNKLVNEEIIEIDGDKIKLTLKGLNLANLAWEEFV